MRIIGTMVGIKGQNYYFKNNNRNKRSITLDLTTERGMEIFLKLIEVTPDVAIPEVDREATTYII